MPLFYQQNIDDHIQLALWKIEEPESFFLESIRPSQSITHPYKRLQHLAGRYLLSQLQEDFPFEKIVIAARGKPMLQDVSCHFSISHGGNFAAAIIRKNGPVGIDIEYKTARLLALAPRFLHEAELKRLEEWEDFPEMYLQLLTLLWSAKEAIYKWYGEGALDFRNQIQLAGPPVLDANEQVEIPFHLILPRQKIALTVHARWLDALVLTWVVL